MLDHVTIRATAQPPAHCADRGRATAGGERPFRVTGLNAPGERPQYHAGYVGAFALDPDGNNIEAVNHNR